MSRVVRLIATGTTLKADDGNRRIIRGIASSISRDRHGDIVVPRGLRWGTLPLPLLAQHNHGDVVGRVTELRATDTAVHMVAEIGEGFGKADEVWRMVRDGNLNALSIGFIGLKSSPMASHGHGLRWIEAELVEVSVVAVGSNRESRITSHAGKATNATHPKSARTGAVQLLRSTS